jgi:hypothetical protein
MQILEGNMQKWRGYTHFHASFVISQESLFIPFQNIMSSA